MFVCQYAYWEQKSQFVKWFRKVRIMKKFWGECEKYSESQKFSRLSDHKIFLTKEKEKEVQKDFSEWENFLLRCSFYHQNDESFM